MKKDNRGANIIALIFTVSIVIFILSSIYGCTPSRGAASMIEPTISRLEAEVANPALPDSLKSMKLDTLRRLKQSQQIADVIIGSGKKVKKNSFNIAINGDATATQNSKVKDLSKVKDQTKVKDQSQVKDKSKKKSKAVTKTGSGSGSPWWMWPVIVALALLSAFLLLRGFLPGFLKIPFFGKG